MVPPYPGPVPPRPADGSTDAQAWALWYQHDQAVNWWIGVHEREAARELAATQRAEDLERRKVLDTQHGEKMLAEAACAAAQTKLAEAQQALAALGNRQLDAPPEQWTDEQLVRQFMLNMADSVSTGTAALDRARRYLFSLRAVYPSLPPSAPTF